MDVVKKLRRWEAAGGHVEVLEQSSGVSTVVLFSCTGGDEMERFAVTTDELSAWRNAAPTDDDDA